MLLLEKYHMGKGTVHNSYAKEMVPTSRCGIPSAETSKNVFLKTQNDSFTIKDL